MAYVFKFPDVGEGIHEGEVVEWLKAEGATVAEDEALVSVETDKAVVELPSPRAGTLLKQHAAAGATIHVGDPLVTIGDAGESLAEPGESTAAEQAPASSTTGPEPVNGVDVVNAASTTAPRRPLATPRTRAMARKLGVDLTSIQGTGSGGRITDEDVKRAAETPQAPAAPSAPVAAQPARPAPTTAPPPTGGVERVPISRLRKTISEAMHASVHHAAHVTHVDEADVTELVARHQVMKGQIEQQWDVRFTLLPLFIKALVAVLKDHPIFNASVDEEAGEILLKHYYNIGVAVDTPQGLIVPVLKETDSKDMVTIAREVADLAERARQRSLSLDELRGGTCTITNIGPLGGVFATPIINQPELAIVGLHKIMERPAVVDGEIVIRKQMYLSVSFDHRWIDGAQGARFMSDLVRLVSNPDLLMARL